MKLKLFFLFAFFMNIKSNLQNGSIDFQTSESKFFIGVNTSEIGFFYFNTNYQDPLKGLFLTSGIIFSGYYFSGKVIKGIDVFVSLLFLYAAMHKESFENDNLLKIWPYSFNFAFVYGWHFKKCNFLFLFGFPKIFAINLQIYLNKKCCIGFIVSHAFLNLGFLGNQLPNIRKKDLFLWTLSLEFTFQI